MLRMRWTTVLGFAAAVGLVVGAPAFAGGVKIGEEVPGFAMKDLNGKEYSLEDVKGNIVVLDFRSQNCPWSRGSDPLLAEIAKDYKAKGVVFFGIDADQENDPDEIKEYAEKVGVSYTILKDEQNVYADKLAAARTPEIYILDKEGKLAYHGAFDNRTVPNQAGDTNYLKNALDELLAGKEVTDPKVSAWGCSINRITKN